MRKQTGGTVLPSSFVGVRYVLHADDTNDLELGDVVFLDLNKPQITSVPGALGKTIALDSLPGKSFGRLASPFTVGVFDAGTSDASTLAVVLEPAADAEFGIGETDLVISVSDDDLNTFVDTYRVVVTDREAPTFVCPADVTFELDAEGNQPFVNVDRTRVEPSDVLDNSGEAVTVVSTFANPYDIKDGPQTVTVCTSMTLMLLSFRQDSLFDLHSPLA